MPPTPLVIGNGPQKVLAFHGWFGSATGWGPLPDLVDGDRYGYAFLDYRGYGARRAETGEYSLAEISRDALEAVDALGWSSFAVLGHSMGGSAAEKREARYAIIDMTTGGRLSSTWIDRMVQSSLDESDPAAFGAYLEAWARTDFAAEVQGDPTPVAVLVGEHDPALGAPVMEQTFLQQYPNASLEVLSNAGHYAMYETPVALLTAVERFLDEL